MVLGDLLTFNERRDSAVGDVMQAYAKLLDEKGPNVSDFELGKFALQWGVTVKSLKEATNAALEYGNALKAEQ